MTIKPRDGAEHWFPDEPMPASFSLKKLEEFQKRIDNIVGTRDGRPIIKLAWAPAEKRWRPHAHGTEAEGYTFPIFIAYVDAQGREVAAPRFVLLQRLEWEQYGPIWEAGRYTIEQVKTVYAVDELGNYITNRFGNLIPVGTTGDGRLWDWKGPCPTERYTELWCHCYHDGTCCPCMKYGICDCGEQYDHCWGRYLDPNDRLLDWIRERAVEARQDSDVNPTEDIRVFEAPNAQRELAGKVLTDREKKKEEAVRFSNHLLSHWERKPHSVIVPN